MRDRGDDADPMAQAGKPVETMGGLFNPNSSLKTLEPGTDPYLEWVKLPPNAPLPMHLTFEQWTHWGQRLTGMGRQFGWKLAYWLAFGENRYGETYLQVAEDLEVGRHHLYKAATVARRFRDVPLAAHLNISTAMELACSALEDDEMRTLAEQVVARRLTKDATRTLVSDYLKAKSLPDEATSIPEEKPAYVRLPAAEVEVLREKASQAMDLEMRLQALEKTVLEGVAVETPPAPPSEPQPAPRVEPESVGLQTGPNIDLNEELDKAARELATLREENEALRLEIAESQRLFPLRVPESLHQTMRQKAETAGWGADVVGWLKEALA